MPVSFEWYLPRNGGKKIRICWTLLFQQYFIFDNASRNHIIGEPSHSLLEINANCSPTDI